MGDIRTNKLNGYPCDMSIEMAAIMYLSVKREQHNGLDMTFEEFYNTFYNPYLENRP